MVAWSAHQAQFQQPQADGEHTPLLLLLLPEHATAHAMLPGALRGAENVYLVTPMVAMAAQSASQSRFQQPQANGESKRTSFRCITWFM